MKRIESGNLYTKEVLENEFDVFKEGTNLRVATIFDTDSIIMRDTHFTAAELSHLIKIAQIINKRL